MLHDLPSQAAYGAIFGAGFDAVLGCSPPSDAVCLRAAPVASVLAAQNEVFGANGISPDFGTRVLPRALKDALSQGDFIRVPVLQGTNANEGRLFEPGEIPFASTLPNIQAAGGPANFDLTHANTYCATPQGTRYAGGVQLSTGGWLVLGGAQRRTRFPHGRCFCRFRRGGSRGVSAADSRIPSCRMTRRVPMRRCRRFSLTRCSPATARIPTAISRVSCRSSATNSTIPNAPPLGSVPVKSPNDVYGFPSASEHSAELQFLFNFDAPLSADEQQLAAQMQTYWANFVSTQDPNRPRHVPLWLPFNFFEALQDLIPGPQRPHPFFTFRREHFCGTWEPIIAAEAGQ